jgi:hypothetical protein
LITGLRLPGGLDLLLLFGRLPGGLTQEQETLMARTRPTGTKSTRKAPASTFDVEASKFVEQIPVNICLLRNFSRRGKLDDFRTLWASLQKKAGRARKALEPAFDDLYRKNRARGEMPVGWILQRGSYHEIGLDLLAGFFQMVLLANDPKLDLLGEHPAPSIESLKREEVRKVASEFLREKRAPNLGGYDLKTFSLQEDGLDGPTVDRFTLMVRGERLDAELGIAKTAEENGTRCDTECDTEKETLARKRGASGDLIEFVGWLKDQRRDRPELKKTAALREFCANHQLSFAGMRRRMTDNPGMFPRETQMRQRGNKAR